MPLPRRTLLVVLAGALAAGCMTTPEATVPPMVEPLELETFFAGRTAGEGRFESGIAGVERTFTVATRGTWDGRTLTLREDFVFDDGERDTKTWRFTRQRDGSFKGTREDVVGVADIWQDGKTVRLAYDAEVVGKGGTTRVLTFEDVLVPQSSTSVLNKAVVSKYGVPVGTVTVVFRKR
ncbi:DUF3833 family protein [Amorphus coralli]|uniref:DUF3833 family protein n=1 Tax=Amorphus coralli TaxID=340680 RepID=UPI000361B711|nr:DUF3833 family protein [Amorphus coralli]